MGVRETVRGLGCMGKVALILLLITAICCLVPVIITGVMVGGLWCLGHILDFCQTHVTLILSIILAGAIVIILKIANKIGKK